MLLPLAIAVARVFDLNFFPQFLFWVNRSLFLLVNSGVLKETVVLAPLPFVDLVHQIVE